ncbi:hypothetical protein [Nostoc sp.]|uniref:hypothetical protein n=1 Tax=Nostoc sp. TaxID=1180 RepID=UPI002FF74114
MELQDYISKVKTKLNESSVVYAAVIVDERTLLNRGYFRASLGYCDYFCHSYNYYTRVD